MEAFDNMFYGLPLLVERDGCSSKCHLSMLCAPLDVSEKNSLFVIWLNHLRID